MKYCSQCKETKEDTEFWKNKSAKDGLQSFCKECLKNYEPRKKATSKYEAKHIKSEGRRISRR